MAAIRFRDDDPALDAFYAQLGDADLQPLWRLQGLLTPRPSVATRPFRWRAAVLRELAARSGELVGLDRGGDRRVLACANPGLGGAPFASSTMWAGVQFLGPGESAPAHRHSPAALRFVLDGEGVWTLVDSDPLHMARGDLVLTPSMTFHEHHNPGSQPMMWLDVLDLPVVAALDAVFYEDGPAEEADPRMADRSDSEHRYGGGPGLLPAVAGKQRQPGRHSPLLAYRWAQTDHALASLLASDSARQAVVRYSNPVTGGDVMPTMRCEMTRVPAGGQSDTSRQTGSRIGSVLNGRGSVRIGPEAFDLVPGDVFVAPSWSTCQLQANAELDVFVTSDAPILEALGLYREDAG
ncbi:MAG: cupin domain-containing protein [Trebonia sp.]